MSLQSHAMKESIHTIEGSGRTRTKAVRLDPAKGPRGKETPEIILWAGSGSLFISADLRGIDLDDLEIRVSGARLIFHGELRSDLLSEKGGIHQEADASKTFRHVLELPYEVEVDQAEVQNENGLISIVLEKRHSVQYNDRIGQSSFTASMKRFFGENGDSSNRLRDEIMILETLERYLEYQAGKRVTR
jgi:HSP20 family molecular chaperone IbpA